MNEQATETTSGFETPMATEQHSVDHSSVPNVPDERFKAAREQGYAKGYRKAQQEFSQYSQQSSANALDPNKLAEIIDAKVDAKVNALEAGRLQKQQEQQALQTWNSLIASAQEAQKSYSDFDQVVGAGYAKFVDSPDILHLAASVPNSAEVLYDLAKNPEKIAVLRTVPAAFREAQMKQIAQSIAKNKEALAAPLPNAPLSHVSPSYSEGVSGGKGKPSIDDFAKLYGG